MDEANRTTLIFVLSAVLAALLWLYRPSRNLESDDLISRAARFTATGARYRSYLLGILVIGVVFHLAFHNALVRQILFVTILAMLIIAGIHRARQEK